MKVSNRMATPIIFCIIMLTGCQNNETTNTNKALEDKEGITQIQNSDAEQLLNSASILGTVVNFSKQGCTLSPALSKDGGQTTKIASAGNDSEETNVNIEYLADCIFQFASIDIEQGTVQYRDASILNIKKQTNLILFGEFSDSKHLQVSKVLIQNFE